MSARVPLPLRWLLSPLPRYKARALSAADAGGVLGLYKPCGLPYYAQSQLAAVQDGRQLLAIHTPAGAGATRAAPRPRTEDTSDALLTRVLDTLQPGATPYPTLPLPSALLLDAAQRKVSVSDHGDGAARVNRWTAAMKGVTLVAQSQGDAFFLRNADQMGLVQYRYRVLGRLPRKVAAALHRIDNNHKSTTSSALTLGASVPSELARIARLNPYVREYMRSQNNAGQRVWQRRVGIADLTSTPRSYSGGRSNNNNNNNNKSSEEGVPSEGMWGEDDVYIGGCTDGDCYCCCLPEDVQQDPLVRSGLFDIAHATLRRRGRLTCFLRPGANATLPAELAALQQHRRRLTRLFMPPSARQTSATDSAHSSRDIHVGQETNTNDDDAAHPWLAPEDILRVSIDAAHTQAAAVCTASSSSSSSSSLSSSASPTTTGKKGRKAARGRAVQLDFELLCVSPAGEGEEGSEEECLALYEVQTSAGVTAQEVSAAFAACGVYVVNDYVHDRRLAQAMWRLTQRMRAAPVSLLAQLPMRVQHAVREGGPESLIAQPLLSCPLERMDDIALQYLHHTLTATYNNNHKYKDSDAGQVRSGIAEKDEEAAHTSDGQEDEWLERLGAVLQQRRQQSHPVRQLLFDLLARSLQQQEQHTGQPDKENIAEGDAEAARRVLPLLWGAGIECVQIAFPDPTCAANVQALQRVVLQREERRLSEQTRRELRQTLQYVTCETSEAASGSVLLRLRADSLLPALLTQHSEQSKQREQQQQQRVIACSLSFALALLSPRATMRALYASLLGIQQKNTTENNMTDILRGAGMSTELMTVPEPYSALFRPRSDEAENTATCDATPPRHTPAPAVALVRAEELGEYVCTLCGAAGHTWHYCSHLPTEVLPALPAPSAGHREPLAIKAREADAASEDTLQVRSGEWLTSVAAAESLIAMQDAAKSTREAREEEMTHRMSPALQGEADDSSEEESMSLVTAVPNVAPTLPYREHVRQHERQKPALHRRSVRCAYCHGRHHITQCPRLAGVDEYSTNINAAASAAASGDHDDVKKEATSGQETQDQPFCIKCGQLGHWYKDCPKIPQGLHLGTHCPICLQPLDKISHLAPQCPQRVRPPHALRHYTAEGVPVAARGAATRPARIPRRQHRRTLLADDFIDKMQRSSG